jgi:hypothetical protein
MGYGVVLWVRRYGHKDNREGAETQDFMSQPKTHNKNP